VVAVRRELDSARARASGFPLIAGLILVDEIKAARIRFMHWCSPTTAVEPLLHSPAARHRSLFRNQELVRHSDGRPNPASIRAGRRTLRVVGQREDHCNARCRNTAPYCGDYADSNVLSRTIRQGRCVHGPVRLRPEELEAIFTPAMIRAHFRVLDMATSCPGKTARIHRPT